MAYGATIPPPKPLEKLVPISYTLPDKRRLVCFPLDGKNEIPQGVAEYLLTVYNAELKSQSSLDV